MNRIDPTAIARQVATFGLDRSEPELAALAQHAMRLGVLPAIVSLLTDRSAPEVARERAVARISAAIVALPAAPLGDVA